MWPTNILCNFRQFASAKNNAEGIYKRDGAEKVYVEVCIDGTWIVCLMERICRSWSADPEP